MEDLGCWVIDGENNDLLNDSTVDYSSSPWKLKDTFEMHCIVCTNYDTLEVVSFIQDEIYAKFRAWVKANVNKAILQNGIDYDLLVFKAALGMDYTIGPDTWDGKEIVFEDTLILSKTLNPDRRGHSLAWWGEFLGEPKTDWRAEAVQLGLIAHDAPRGAEFKTYHPRMRDYCEQDTIVNLHQYAYLMQEWGDWDWEEAYRLEMSVAEIISRQSHRGFWFDKELAVANVKELDELMAERRAIVEPKLPPKPMGKTKLKEYIPGEKQFKKDGEPNANIIKWCEKHGGAVVKEGDNYTTTLYGKQYTLPIPVAPILDTEPSNIEDTTFIKGLLVRNGWNPSQYKERDLTVDTKKQKLSPDKFKETVERYVEQTLSSPFCLHRCEKLGVMKGKLLEKLLKHDLKKPLKVYTNPTLTVGQDKEIDPALNELEADFPYVKQIVEYLTYRHRRNSILGGGLDPDDWDEDDDTTKGFLANVRSDGRIPTPADTCGAATGRMLHRIVVNVPRSSSLYGANMRGLFGVDGNMAQFAFDFSSLEGRIEGHYCYRYDAADKAYCNSLIQEKPFDVHTRISERVSELIGQKFSRQSSKPVKYGCTYGSQADRVAKIIGCDRTLGLKIFNAFWEAAEPLGKLRDKLEAYWETTGGKKYILGLDGRKIMTRSKHALLNSLFQSGGVICAKRTMVYQDRLLRERGLIVDFWKDDWKTKQYVQQLISMHDEAQFEISKSLLKWKKFANEEEANVWKAENDGWTVVHNTKGFFAMQSPMNEITQQAVELTNKLYKLNVPLAVEAAYGMNWRDCH